MGCILHSDLNCFYASVEMNENPALKGQRVAVCGSTENRHGIVLTASYPAKRMGVKTGMANWEAREACPDLIMVEPHYELYIKYSRLVRDIYKRYANDIEPFGMDECWLGLGQYNCREGQIIAEEIRSAVKEETGLTVSVGVSFTKIFAKLGSDMKKPDAVTVINEDNFKEKVWPLPVSELLYVGRATTKKLMGLGVYTIGDLANYPQDILGSIMGKNGKMLWRFANGLDHAPVMPAGYEVPVKSVGHGVTCKKDLDTPYQVWTVLYELSQDLTHRLLKYRMLAGGVQLTIKDNELNYRQYQAPVKYHTRCAIELTQTAYELFTRNYSWAKSVRALTICAINLKSDDELPQLDLFDDCERHLKRQTLDEAVDDIRRRFGYSSIKAASLMDELNMATDKCELVKMPNLMYM